MKIVIPDQGMVIRYYGEDLQTHVHMEECAELIQALSKVRRNPGEFEHLSNLAEEMADLLICLEQMKEMYGITDRQLQNYVDYKTGREMVRIADQLVKDVSGDIR